MEIHYSGQQSNVDYHLQSKQIITKACLSLMNGHVISKVTLINIIAFARLLPVNVFEYFFCTNRHD